MALPGAPQGFEIRHGSGGAAAGAADTARPRRLPRADDRGDPLRTRLVRRTGCAERTRRSGRNYVLRADGGTEELGPFDQTEMGVDDVFVIETPGGGGYGTIK